MKKVPFSLSSFVVISVLFFFAGCATKKVNENFKPDPAIERDLSSGLSKYNKGDIEKSAFYYKKALDKARLANDSKIIADAAYNYAAVMFQAGDINSALTSLKEAEAEYTFYGNVPSELYLLYARTLERNKKYEEAISKLELISENSSEKLLAQKILIYSRILLFQNKIDEAEKELSKLIKSKKLFASLSPIFQAEAMELSAELSRRKGDHQNAVRNLKKAMELYQQARAYQKMAETAQAIASTLKKSNKTESAEYYLQAARTFYYLQQTNSLQQILKELDAILADQNTQLPFYTTERIDIFKAILAGNSSNVADVAK